MYHIYEDSQIPTTKPKNRDQVKIYKVVFVTLVAIVVLV